MLVLTTTSEKFQIKTSSTADIDYFVVWSDQGPSGSIGQASGTVNTVTTTDFVASPAASYRRVLQSFTIKNRHASAQQGVTFIFYDGTNGREVREVLVNPGDTFSYDLRTGFGYQPRIVPLPTGSTPAINALNLVVLASDVTNNNSTANTIANVTGLSFPVVSGGTYRFRFVIQYTSAATATGSRWSVSGPGSPTALRYGSVYSLTATSRTFNDGLAAYDLPAASNATSAATGANTAEVEGYITASADGTVIARFASEVASSAIVAKAGSICEWVRVL